MKTRSNAVPIEEQALATSPPTSDNIVQLRAGPPPAPAAGEADRQHAPVVSATHQRRWWMVALAAVALLFVGGLAALLLTPHPVPPVPSYNSRLTDLDTKLSKALATQLHAAGFDFDAAIVSVEAPACQRAVCLVKFLRRENPAVTGFKAGISVRHAGNGLWSFAGTGWLDQLQFSVDAADEMQRLAESTPPEFPQVARVALTSDQPRLHPGAAFAREIEILLPITAEGQSPHWLDLETGTGLTEPHFDFFANAPANLVWVHTNRLDLFSVFGGNGGYWLITSQMALAPVDAKLWERATPEEIVSHPALRAILHPKRLVRRLDSQQDTYIFRTAQGTFGILRFLERNPASPQLKIRYRVARWGSMTGS